MADTRWWVGATDTDWNKSGNWSATEGGTGGAGVPTSVSTAKFSHTSGAVNCVLSADAVCAALYMASADTGGSDDFEDTLDLNGFNLTAGGVFKDSATSTLLLGSGTLSVGGDFNIKGTFTYETGTVKITGTSTITMTAGELYNLTLDCGTSVVSIANSIILKINGDMRLTALGGIYSNTYGHFYLYGNLIACSSAPTGGNGYFDWSFRSTTKDQDVYFDKAGGTGHIVGVLHNNFKSGTSYNANLFDTLVMGGFDYNNAHVIAGTSTVILKTSATGTRQYYFTNTYSYLQTYPSECVFNNLTIDVGSDTELYMYSSFSVSGTLILSNLLGIYNAGSAGIKCQGDVQLDCATLTGSGTLSFVGANAQSVTGSGGGLPGGTITLNKTNATDTVTLARNLNLGTTGQDLVLTKGVLKADGYNLQVNDSFTIAADATLALKGSETTVSTPTIATGGTVLYYGDNVASTKTIKNWSYKNLTINDVNANKSTFQLAESHTGIESMDVLGGTFDANGYNVTITCLTCGLVINGGTLLAGEGTWTIACPFTYTSGTFTAETSTFVTSGNNTITGSVTFYNLTIGSGITTKVADGTTLTVNNTLSGALTGNSSLYGSGSYTGAVVLKGNMTTGGSTYNFGVNVLLTIDGTGDQTLTGNAGAGAMYLGRCTINKASGTLYLVNNLAGSSSGVTGAFTLTAGTVSAGTSKVTFSDNDVITINSALTLYDMAIGNTSVTVAGSLSMTVSGTLSAGTNNWNSTGGNIDVPGNMSFGASGGGGSTTFTFTGSGASTYTSTGTILPSTLTINKSGAGTVTLLSNLVLSRTGQDLTVTTGTLDLAGYNLTVNDTLSLGANGTLRLKGNETITAAVKSMVNSAILEYYDAAVTAVINNFSSTLLPSIKFLGGKTHNFTASANYSSAGTWQVSGGTGKAILRSTVDATYWNLNFTGTNSLSSSVDVKDSDAHTGNLMLAYGSVNSGHNLNWLFASIAAMGMILEDDD